MLPATLTWRLAEQSHLQAACEGHGLLIRALFPCYPRQLPPQSPQISMQSILQDGVRFGQKLGERPTAAAKYSACPGEGFPY